MADEIVLRVDNLTKKFFVDPRMGRKPGYYDILKLMLGIDLDSEQLRAHEFHALKSISFDLRRGEALGVMGLNGAGKSTLLSVLLGRLPLDGGSYTIKGTVGGLVELNAGFHREMTGLENIYNKARMIGIPDKEVKTRLEEIVEFADLGDFIDSPVKTYSSGMNVRLGFSIAIHFVQDLILCDEILAVGDFDFRQKCLSKINELRKKKSFVLVSHSTGDIATFCDKAIILHKGAKIFEGAPDAAIEAYAQCNHHLSSDQARERIEESLSLRMKGESENGNLRSMKKSKRLFFQNLDFRKGLESWIFSGGNGRIEIDAKKSSIFCKDQDGNFTLRQEIDRECVYKLECKLKVVSGEVELMARQGGVQKLVKTWASGFNGKISESLSSNCVWFHCKDIERFPGGLEFQVRDLSIDHDIEVDQDEETLPVISDEAKVMLFGPEFHKEEIIQDISLESNLRKRENGYYYVTGDYFVMNIKYTLLETISSLRIGIPFFKQDGEMLLGPDSRNYGQKDDLRKAGKHEVCMVIDPLPVNKGRLWFTLTFCEDPAHLFRKHIMYFDIVNPTNEYGVIKSFPVWMKKWDMQNSSKIYSSSG